MATDWSKYAVNRKNPSKTDWSKYAVANKSPQERKNIFNPEAMGKAIHETTVDPFMAGMEGVSYAGGELGHGILQPALESGALGEGVKKRSQEVAKARVERYLEAQKKHPYAATAGNIFGGAGITAPLSFIGGGLPMFAKGALMGGALGAGTYVNPDESRFLNTLIGAGTGAAIPAGISAGKLGWNKIIKPTSDLVKRQFGHKGKVAQNVFQGLPENEIAPMLEAQEAGKRLGLQLTPAEASGNPILGKTEGKLGVIPETEQAFYEFKKGQKGAQEQAIEKLMHDISPSPDVVNMEARKTAQDIIEKKMKALQKKAKPHYEAAEKQSISPTSLKNILKDSNISKAYEQVTHDPLYQTELEKFGKSSIKVLDQVKKNLDGKYNNFKQNGYTHEAGIIDRARKKLKGMTDSISPEYKKARSIYAEDLPAVLKIKESKIGKISEFNDEQSKNISKTLFDPSETDLKSFLRVRNEMQQENPKVWNSIIRNEMERRMSASASIEATENYGSEFYRNILAKDKDYKKFYAALGNPSSKEATLEQRKLADMRKAFKGLINSRTVKTSFGQAETKMTSPGRGSISGRMIEFYDNLINGKYDKAAVEIVTDKDWKKYLSPAIKKEIKGEIPKNRNQWILALSGIEAKKITERDKGE